MEHVPDPTDFPPEADAPGLRKLDGAFSCQICGEVYDAPMMLNCGHSFCSMCVRRSLRDRHECPSCRNPAEEMHLVKNAQLEDLCDSWRSARTTILKLIENADTLAKKALHNAESDVRQRKKRKMNSPSTPGPSTERDSVEVIDDSDAELPNREYVPSSDPEENEAQLQGNVIVTCPMCNYSIFSRHVNEHMDSDCKSFLVKSKSVQISSKNAWNTILGNGSPRAASRIKGKRQQKSTHIDTQHTEERLPKPSYKVLKDKAIREMLTKHQLSTLGSREQLIARHTQFVLLFNANLDRAQQLRKTVDELRRDLRKWEDTLDVKKVSVEDSQSYVKTKNFEFKKHIEAARASARSKAQDSGLQLKVSGTHASSKSTQGDVAANGDRKGLPAESSQNTSLEKTIIPDSEGEDTL